VNLCDKIPLFRNNSYGAHVVFKGQTTLLEHCVTNEAFWHLKQLMWSVSSRGLLVWPRVVMW